jgi:integrase
VRYRSTQSRLVEYFGEKRIGEIDRPKTIGFRDWMMGRVKPITVKDRVVACSTCWDWAVEHRIVQENPWSGLSVRVPSRKKESPFSQDETFLILDTFEKGEDWLRFYSDFVRFLFTTGCRIGEAIALQWTNDKPRTITVPQSIAERLDRRDKSRSLVFPAPEGGLLDDKNFNRRAWRTALRIADIEYRRPYSIRGSAITRMLRSGMSPIDVSAITGHSARTLYQCYVLPLQEGRLPEL